LGWWIKRHEGRIVGGLEFRREELSRGHVAWRVVQEVAVSAVSAGFSQPIAKTVTHATVEKGGINSSIFSIISSGLLDNAITVVAEEDEDDEDVDADEDVCEEEV
jgi:hypothetical protein